MKRFLRLADPQRRLELSTSGKWYIVLTIAIGVVALISGNNVLYLAESLLLSGLIVSGILSERAVAAVEVSLLPGEAVAGEVAGDRLRVKNKKNFPLFCIEIGEWSGKERQLLGYVPRLQGQEEIHVRSLRRYESRGVSRREGLWIATSAPFGFARKIRYLHRPGDRLVWPGPKDPTSSRARPQARPGQHGGILEPILGEVRPFAEGDPLSDVIWTLSARGNGWWIRPRRPSLPTPTVVLDRRCSPSEHFEQKVRECAQPFLQGHEATLVIKDSRGRSIHAGRLAALNLLATIEPERPPS